MSTPESDRNYALNIDQMRQYLPHRSPFLLLDRILDIKVGKDLTSPRGGPDKLGITVTALKNVSYNEPFFPGHFPEIAIMPGVLVIEAMAQAACFTLYPYLERDIDKMARDFRCILVGVDGVRFRRPVIPGDALILESVVTKCRGSIWAFKATAKVEGQLVAEADLLANLTIKGDAP